LVDNIKKSTLLHLPRIPYQKPPHPRKKQQPNHFLQSRLIHGPLLKSLNLITVCTAKGERFLRPVTLFQLCKPLSITAPHSLRSRRTSLRYNLGAFQNRAQREFKQVILNLHQNNRSRPANKLHHKYLGLPKYRPQPLSSFCPQHIYTPSASHPKAHPITREYTALNVTLRTIRTMSSTGSRKRKLEDDATKYYAVKAGHTTGVFESWADCQESITGFKGAVCK